MCIWKQLTLIELTLKDDTMQKYLVVTVLACDKPGIANQITSIATENNCNILDSRMAALGKEFAVVMMICGDSASISNFEKELANLEKKLDLLIQSKYTEPADEHISLLPYSIQVIALDAPGIIKDISTFFSSQSVNIENMHTDSYKAPHTAAPMIAINMTVNIPVNMQIAEMRDQFIDFCDELNLDASIEPLKGFL